MDSTNEKLILATAEDVLKENGTLTTLDLKEELIERYPDIMWYQEDVSFALMKAHDNGGLGGRELKFHDTGKYRVYAFSATTSGAKKFVTKTKLAGLVQELIGTDKEVTIRFTKKNGDKRTMVCTVESLNPLGYYSVIEDGEYRLIDSRTISLVIIDSNVYALKK